MGLFNKITDIVVEGVKFVDDLAKDPNDFHVREEKIRNSIDQDFLLDIAKYERTNTLRKLAASRITDFDKILDLVINGEYFDASEIGITKIKDQRVLEELTYNHDQDVRYLAITRLTDKELLVNVAKNTDDYTIGKIAVEKINDMIDIIDIAKNGRDSLTRSKAIERITDKEILEDLAKNDYKELIRISAGNRLHKLKSREKEDIKENNLLENTSEDNSIPDRSIEKIDINTANKEELSKLPTINSIQVIKILQMRENGNYITSFDDLKNKLNIKEYQINQLKEYIIINIPSEDMTNQGRKLDI